MRLTAIWALMTLSAATLTSCATPPKKVNFDNSRTYASSKDAVWEAVISFFTKNNIQIKTIEKDSGVLYAERSSVDESMADCGDFPLAPEIERSGTLNVFVRHLQSGTEVTVNTEFKDVRIFDNKTFTNSCNSTGLLEKNILDSIN